MTRPKLRSANSRSRGRARRVARRGGSPDGRGFGRTRVCSDAGHAPSVERRGMKLPDLPATRAASPHVRDHEASRCGPSPTPSSHPNALKHRGHVAGYVHESPLDRIFVNDVIREHLEPAQGMTAGVGCTNANANSGCRSRSLRDGVTLLDAPLKRFHARVVIVIHGHHGRPPPGRGVHLTDPTPLLPLVAQSASAGLCARAPSVAARPGAGWYLDGSWESSGC
jgi:hypothetical protein